MKLTDIPRSALIVGLSAFAALMVLVVSRGIDLLHGGGHATAIARSQRQQAHGRPRPGGHRHPPARAGRGPRRPTTTRQTGSSHSRRASRTRGAATSTPGGLSLSRAVGQLIISTFAGTAPPPQMLDAVRSGRTGAVILMGDNTAAGVLRTRESVDELQSAARAGGNPGLLIMTDQEGGEVKRLPGPPDAAATQMADPEVAYRQGVLTGGLLRRSGVNLDLAPVADVSRTDGFMTQEQRTFGTRPDAVAQAACSFARGLQRAGIGYTLKHFPGLGDATDTTDDRPVSISESASDIHADDLAYRRCASGPDAAVMVSSASYVHLTGSTPAVLSRRIYHHTLPGDHVHALTISDSFESGAIGHLSSPAIAAINAGLDMVMYPGDESVSAQAYVRLLADARTGVLSRIRVQDAAAAVLAYKHDLGLAGR